MVVFPAPVEPTNAIFCPALAPKEILFRITLPESYPKVTELKLTSPFTSVRETAAGTSGISGISSIIWKMRSAPARADCKVLY